MADAPKRPLEFYGCPIDARDTQELRKALKAQSCPFLGKRCVKQRKSESKQTIGTCIVGYGGDQLIVCPHRFIKGGQIFLDCIHLLPPGLQYWVVPEVTMPGGCVDYFLVAMDGKQIIDYLGIEIQGLDTTQSGGIWTARNDALKDKLGETYPYGINWKMSAKTILVLSKVNYAP